MLTGNKIIDGARLLQHLSERPDRVGIRDTVAEAKPEKAQERQQVLDQELRALVGQRMHSLKGGGLKHQNVIERRPPAAGPVRPRHGRLKSGAEHLKINESLRALRSVALGGKRSEPFINIKQTRSPLRDIRTPNAN